jgi:hypothetical protein
LLGWLAVTGGLVMTERDLDKGLERALVIVTLSTATLIVSFSVLMFQN